jgi:hypothetical protein
VAHGSNMIPSANCQFNERATPADVTSSTTTATGRAMFQVRGRGVTRIQQSSKVRVRCGPLRCPSRARWRRANVRAHGAPHAPRTPIVSRSQPRPPFSRSTCVSSRQHPFRAHAGARGLRVTRGSSAPADRGSPLPDGGGDTSVPQGMRRSDCMSGGKSRSECPPPRGRSSSPRSARKESPYNALRAASDRCAYTRRTPGRSACLTREYSAPFGTCFPQDNPHLRSCTWRRRRLTQARSRIAGRSLPRGIQRCLRKCADTFASPAWVG